MANLELTNEWTEGVYRIETTDPVLGGEDGISNKAAKDLGSRTNFLKNSVETAQGTANFATGVANSAQQNVDYLNTLITDYHQDELREKAAASGIRQGVISAKHGTVENAAYPSFLNLTSNSSAVYLAADGNNPLIVSLSGGNDVTQPINYYYWRMSDLTIPLPSTSGDYLIVMTYTPLTNEMNITAETYQPVLVSYSSPASPINGQYWYDLGAEKMYRRVAGAWEQKIAIILGRVIPADTIVQYYPTIRKSIKQIFGVGDVPAGTIHMFAGQPSNVPDGYIICNGADLSKRVYSYLYKALGTIYGSGTPQTFRVPDLRGEFVRGLDNGRGIDPNRAVGSSQIEQFKMHGHSYEKPDTVVQAAAGTALNVFSSSLDNFATSATGDEETRPRNVAMLYIIKY